ncbi:DUF302 domain-containing protein [Nocardia arthritidis]|uniref:DUF302 domain-containing protein n=1 Tax=Nocardia arthritidis TaxID=228602 RepID=A0A6G9YH43_9NOCA|nr:DUF302 domain-containing protein [Nocardia arthritidis]
MSYRITVVESSPHTLLELRRAVRAEHAGDDIAAGMRELYDLADRTGLAPAGPPSTTYRGAVGPGRATEVVFGLPVTSGLVGGAAEQVSVRPIAPGLFAYTTHHGDFQRIGEAYRALEEWVRASHFRPVGPSTEVYLVAPDEAVHPHDLVTEIRIPVAAAELATRIAVSFGQAVGLTRDALAEQGFGLLTEIDVRATMRAKLGVEMEDYLILGAYNPELAHRALDIDRHIGLLLPCNVVVRTAEGAAIVEAMDPDLLLDRDAQPALYSVAREARSRLAAALENIEKRSAIP